MKTLTILGSVFLACSVSYAQDFGSVGTEWHFNKTGNAAPNSSYQHYKSMKDSVILGKTCHLIQSVFHSVHHAAQSGPNYLVYQSGDTVFAYNAFKNQFLRFLLFNREAGDSFELDVLDSFFWSQASTYKVYVDSVRMLHIQGQDLKLHHVRVSNPQQNYQYGSTFIDKIGWISEFHQIPFPSIPSSGSLRCYSDAGIDTNFQSHACDFLIPGSSIQALSKQNISVYPNPVQSVLRINLSEDFIYSIYNMYGQLVDEGISHSEIKVSHLTPATYFIHTYSEGIWYTGKFIKE